MNPRETEEGEIETKVETVDYRSPPGKEAEEPTKEKIEVVHLTHDKGKSPTTAGGVLTAAAETAKNAFESTKEAISGINKDSKQ